MALTIPDILDHVVSHAMATGYFERVNTHEPKNAPGHGLSCAAWVEKVTPALSGLNQTSVQVTFKVRLFSNMVAEPQDGIDPELTRALDAMMSLYSGDFTFDGTVYAVDLLGSEGEGLHAEAGYVEVDKKLYRIFDITVPVTVNDVWTQTA
jgi:hypothetical protein